MHQGSKNLVRLLDEYSIVIQEFFQIRMDHFMETVGKEIFGIEFSLVKFEFSPTRGQIHGHLLAILKDQSMSKVFYNLRDDKEAQAKFLHEWSKGVFNYTAEVVHDVYGDLEMGNGDNPCMERFGDCVEDIQLDQQRLLRFCQEHRCSGFCLRHKKKRKECDDVPSQKKRRYAKFKMSTLNGKILDHHLFPHAPCLPFILYRFQSR